MWKPAINSLVNIRHPSPAMAAMLARFALSSGRNTPPKFRVESLIVHSETEVEAILQPEHGQYPPDTTHTIYTSWLIPAE